MLIYYFYLCIDDCFRLVKKHGSVCDYIEQRDKELYHRYREALASAQTIHLDELLLNVINSPTSRLWLSEYRATEVVKELIRNGGRAKYHQKRGEMYREVWRRYKALAAKRPNDSIEDIVYDAVNSPANSFYLTIGSAKVIICKIRCKLRRLK